MGAGGGVCEGGGRWVWLCWGVRVHMHMFMLVHDGFTTIITRGRGGGVELPTRVPYMLPCGLRNIPSTQNTDTETTVLN